MKSRRADGHAGGAGVRTGQATLADAGGQAGAGDAGGRAVAPLQLQVGEAEQRGAGDAKGQAGGGRDHHAPDLQVRLRAIDSSHRQRTGPQGGKGQ